MTTIARRLAILTFMMSIFAISFAALATHNPRIVPCPSGGLGPTFSTSCTAMF